MSLNTGKIRTEKGNPIMPNSTCLIYHDESV